MSVEAMLEKMLSMRADGYPECAVVGLCSNLSTGYYADELWLQEAFRAWPKFSGEIQYPVPHPTQSPEQAYLGSCDPWGRENEYGRNRWELLDFLIERAQAKLGQGRQA